MLDGFGIRNGGRVLPVVIRDERRQEPPGLPLVRGVVIDLQRRELTVAERQVHPARPDPLGTGEQVRVEPDLGDGARLGGPGKLRVDHFVVVPGRAWLTVRRGEQPGPDEEVRTTEQGRAVGRLVSQEHALVHDVGTAADGCQRGLRGVGLRSFGDLRHVPAGRAEPPEHRRLVRLAACHQVLEADIERAGRLDFSPRVQQVQPRQMATRDEVGDITRRQTQPVPVKPHDTPS